MRIRKTCLWQKHMTITVYLKLYATFTGSTSVNFESPDVDFASFAHTKGLQSRVRNQTIPIAPAHTKLCIDITACNQYVGARDGTSKTTSSMCLWSTDFPSKSRNKDGYMTHPRAIEGSCKMLQPRIRSTHGTACYLFRMQKHQTALQLRSTKFFFTKNETSVDKS